MGPHQYRFTKLAARQNESPKKCHLVGACLIGCVFGAAAVLVSTRLFEASEVPSKLGRKSRSLNSSKDFADSLTTASNVLQRSKRAVKSGELKLRGTNLGGWLLAEYWMTKNSPAWKGVPEDIANAGEYATMKYLGHEKGDVQFDKHRETFITEQDFALISAAGLNSVRIPVGFWICEFDRTAENADDYKMYAPGSLSYLDKAVREWAKRHSLMVIVDLHGAKGSQNGNDHSAPKSPGQRLWDKSVANVNSTLDAIDFLVARYKTEDAFLGVSLLNEPVGLDVGVLKQFYYDAYGRIRYDAKTDCIIVVAPLLNEQSSGSRDWRDFMRPPGWTNVMHDWHRYNKWGFENVSPEWLIDFVKTGLRRDFESWTGNPLMNGEWSLASGPELNATQLREYAKEQLATFDKASGGWFFWSWKHYGKDDGKLNVWSLKSVLQHGYLKLQ